MPVQVRALSFAGQLIAYRVTCPFCANRCTLNIWVRLAAGAVSLASAEVAAVLAILFVNAQTQLVAAHLQLGIAFLAAAAIIMVIGGQALAVVICSRFGSLVKPGVL